MNEPPQSLEELEERVSRPSDGVLEALRHLEGDVMVAGAGGKMGFHLCLMLRRAFDLQGKSNRVLAVSRFGDRDSLEPFHEKAIETIPADLTSTSVVAGLPDVSALFFLAGRKFGTADSPDILRLFNETMPAIVADRFAGTPTVALSTGCVYPFVPPESGGSKESDPVDPQGSYAISCRGRELAFLESSRRHRTPIGLIRLNYSVDLRYGVLVDLAQRVLAEDPVDLEMGYLNCIWQGDALAQIARSLDHVSAAPEALILNVTGERILRVRDIAERFSEIFGKPVRLRGSEAETAWLSDATRSHHLLGPPEVPEEVLFEWVADWVANDRPTLGKPTQFEVRDGKY